MIPGNSQLHRPVLSHRIKRLCVSLVRPAPRRNQEQKAELLTRLAAHNNLPKLKVKNVEKLRGIPSFYQSQRAMARVHAKAPGGNGFDGAGILVHDSDELISFAESHGVTCCPGESGELADEKVTYVTHCFYGDVGLIEKIDNSNLITAQFDLDGDNLGPIRPHTSGDPNAMLDVDKDVLAVLLSDSAKLSLGIPRPYVQLTWTNGQQPTLVALDVAPERLPYFTPDEDARLGKLFYEARARMMVPIAEQGALTPRIPGGVFVKELERV